MNIKLLGGVGLVAVAVVYMMSKPATVPSDTRLAIGAAMVTVTLPEIFTEQALIGKRGFDAKCVHCHGENAQGQSGIAPPLIHKIYEPSHHSDAAIVLAAKNGVRAHHWKFGNMPPVPGLTGADIRAVARYIRELQQENGIF